MNKIYFYLLGGWEVNMLIFNYFIWEGEENDVIIFINLSFLL